MESVVPAWEGKKTKKNKVAFSFDILQSDGILILQLKGHVLEDECLKDLYVAVEENLENGRVYFVVDLEKVTHMNSPGLNFLIRLLTKSRNNGGELVIVNLSEKIENLLIVSKLKSVFETADSIDEAKKRILQKNTVK